MLRDLGRVRHLLAVATRTDESNDERAEGRYVEPSPGILDTLAAARPHLLTGRRGTGKSTLLFVLRKRLKNDSVQVLYVDMQKFQQREYPDVLIEVLLALIEEWKPRLAFATLLPDAVLRNERRRLSAELTMILRDPSVRTRVYNSKKRSVSERAAQAKANLKHKNQGGGLSGSRSASQETEWAATSEFEELKIQRLQASSGRFQEFYKKLVERSEAPYAVVFLDDFYFVPLDDQPMVLGFLHQIFKGAGIHLKVGGVGTRLNPYREGNPPQGMELGHDISPISLDVSLEQFTMAKRFLEEMLQGILGDVATVEDMINEGARNRMVLVCGGAVARDYITLMDGALSQAIDRLGKTEGFGPETHIRVQTEDVQKAARKQVSEKENQAFTLDSGTDRTALSDRWRDICDFARVKETGFILVPHDSLRREAWGAEVQTLEGLRLLHKVGNGVPNNNRWKGMNCAIYMLDLGQLSSARLTTSIPEFWKGEAQLRKLKQGGRLYSPDWKRETSVEPGDEIEVAVPAID